MTRQKSRLANRIQNVIKILGKGGEYWEEGLFATDKDGFECGTKDKCAKYFCLDGALQHICKTNKSLEETRTFLASVILNVKPEQLSNVEEDTDDIIISFNDGGKKWVHIRNLLNKALKTLGAK